jgi:guanine nucleotide-binding protein subunit alpha
MMLIAASKKCVDELKIAECAIDPSITASVDAIKAMEATPERDRQFNTEFVEHMTRLWQDAGIRKTYFEHMQNHPCPFLELTPYVLDHVADFFNPSYKFTAQDWLWARVRTNGVCEHTFFVPFTCAEPSSPSTFTLNLIDAGGARSERRKWVHVYEDVSAVIFVASLNHIDQVLFEDYSDNALLESLKLFEDLMSNSRLTNVPFVIYLNMVDAFVEKIEKRGTKMRSIFPDYPEHLEGQAEAAKTFIKDQFVVRAGDATRPLEVHFTNTVSIEQMRPMLRSMVDMIGRLHMRKDA